MKDINTFQKMKRIKISKDELIIIETDEGFIVNADSSYGYSIADKELRISCDKENVK